MSVPVEASKAAARIAMALTTPVLRQFNGPERVDIAARRNLTQPIAENVAWNQLSTGERELLILAADIRSMGERLCRVDETLQAKVGVELALLAGYLCGSEVPA